MNHSNYHLSLVSNGSCHQRLIESPLLTQSNNNIFLTWLIEIVKRRSWIIDSKNGPHLKPETLKDQSLTRDYIQNEKYPVSHLIDEELKFLSCAGSFSTVRNIYIGSNDLLDLLDPLRTTGLRDEVVKLNQCLHKKVRHTIYLVRVAKSNHNHEYNRMVPYLLLEKLSYQLINKLYLLKSALTKSYLIPLRKLNIFINCHYDSFTYYFTHNSNHQHSFHKTRRSHIFGKMRNSHNEKAIDLSIQSTINIQGKTHKEYI